MAINMGPAVSATNRAMRNPNCSPVTSSEISEPGTGPVATGCPVVHHLEVLLDDRLPVVYKHECVISLGKAALPQRPQGKRAQPCSIDQGCLLYDSDPAFSAFLEWANLLIVHHETNRFGGIEYSHPLSATLGNADRERSRVEHS